MSLPKITAHVGFSRLLSIEASLLLLINSSVNLTLVGLLPGVHVSYEFCYDYGYNEIHSSHVHKQEQTCLITEKDLHMYVLVGCCIILGQPERVLD